MIWTKPLWGHVPAVNLPGCRFDVQLGNFRLSGPARSLQECLFKLWLGTGVTCQQQQREKCYGWCYFQHVFFFPGILGDDTVNSEVCWLMMGWVKLKNNKFQRKTALFVWYIYIYSFSMFFHVFFHAFYPATTWRGFFNPEILGEFLRLGRYDQRQPDPWDIAYELQIWHGYKPPYIRI